MQPNPKRSTQPNIFTFILYLFEKFTSIETVCRRESIKLWEALVLSLPPKNPEKMPDDPRIWITEYNPRVKGNQSIFRKLARISFEDDKEDVQMHEVGGGAA